MFLSLIAMNENQISNSSKVSTLMTLLGMILVFGLILLPSLDKTNAYTLADLNCNTSDPELEVSGKNRGGRHS